MYPDGKMDKITANIIAENMLSQVDFESHHYQVLTELTYHYRYYIDITKVYGFIKSINGNLHQKRNILYCKRISGM